MKIKQLKLNIPSSGSSDDLVKFRSICIRKIIDKINEVCDVDFDIKYGFSPYTNTNYSYSNDFNNWLMNTTITFNKHNSVLHFKNYSDNGYVLRFHHDIDSGISTYLYLDKEYIDNTVTFTLFYENDKFYLFDDSITTDVSYSETAQISNFPRLIMGYENDNLMVYNNIFNDSGNYEIGRNCKEHISDTFTFLNNSEIMLYNSTNIFYVSERFKEINRKLNVGSIYNIDNNYYFAFWNVTNYKTMLLNIGKEFTNDKEILEVNSDTLNDFAKYIQPSE